MSPWVKFSLAMTARTIGMLAEHFAQWLFHQVSNGADAAGDFLEDVWEFCQWFLQMTAGQLCGRSSRRNGSYEEEWQPGLYAR